MFTKAQNITKETLVRVLLAVSVLFILASAPTIPAAYADCVTSGTGSACSG